MTKFTFDSKSRLEPGFAAAVLKNDKIVWKKCIGMADLGKKMPITPQTNFRLASLSKQFTAMAVMILIERKKLSLKNKLSDFFSGFPAYGNKVSVRQLLTHTAGIPDHEKPLYRTIRPGDEPTMADALDILKSQSSPLFPPGSEYQYSDSGYVLLALIIEKVSGLTYREFLKQNIFSPLSMIGSDVLDQTKPKIKNRALGYKRMRLPRSPRRPRNDDENENFEIFDYDPLNYIVGDEGVYSSINDMAKWSRAWDEEILVSRKNLAEATTPALLGNGNFGKAGFSWLFGNILNRFRVKPGMTRIIYQDGSWVGFRNIILKIPEKKLTVVVLSNRTDLNTEQRRISLAYKLVREFL